MAESITEGTLKQFSKRMQLAHSFFAIFPKKPKCPDTNFCFKRLATLLSVTRRLLPSRPTRYSASYNLKCWLANAYLKILRLRLTFP